MAVIAVTKERRAGETRVAAVPETVKKLVAAGFTVTVETGAGDAASYPDADFVSAGASLAKTAKEAIAKADILFKVRPPEADEIKALKSGAIVVATLNPYMERPTLDALAKAGVSRKARAVKSEAKTAKKAPAQKAAVKKATTKPKAAEVAAEAVAPAVEVAETAAPEAAAQE